MTVILNVLPGDAYIDTFRETGIEGDVVICRECLIDGEVAAANLHEFWKMREQHLERAYPDSGAAYAENVAAELGKLIDLPSGAIVNLFFENELFCQANMWFCLYLLRDTRADVWRIAPPIDDDPWKGFGGITPGGLLGCYRNRIKFAPDELRLGAELWTAFAGGDKDRLTALGERISPAFFYLKDVCAAANVRDTLPLKIVKEIVDAGTTEFSEVFLEFSRRAGVYGYGDLQVKRLLDELKD